MKWNSQKFFLLDSGLESMQYLTATNKKKYSISIQTTYSFFNYFKPNQILPYKLSLSRYNDCFLTIMWVFPQLLMTVYSDYRGTDYVYFSIPTFFKNFSYDQYYVTCINLIIFFKRSSLYLYQSLSEMTVIDLIDFPSKTAVCERYNIIYILTSITYNRRLIVLLPITDNSKVISISNIYSSGNWLEREVFDMFGLYFLYHPALNRILTDYGFSEYPLKRDFPCEGYYSVVYSNYLHRIIYLFD
jgi:NADH:ubiquinone oxidoreductase subunit C